MNPLHPSLLDEWLPFVQAFGPSLVALVTAVIAAVITIVIQSRQIAIAQGVKDIAHRQYINAQKKLRLELFQYRYKAYQDVVESIEACVGITSASNRIVLYKKFYAVIEPVRFLFDEKIFLYLNDYISELIRNHNDAHKKVEFMQSDDLDIEEITEAANRSYFILHDELKKFDDLMVPYLRVEQEH